MIGFGERRGRPVGNHPAGAQTDDAIGELDREFDLVQADEYGRLTLFFNSCPIPPAPTTPSTVEERTLNSQT
jgi:hypothetical protein